MTGDEVGVEVVITGDGARRFATYRLTAGNTVELGELLNRIGEVLGEFEMVERHTDYL